MKHRTPVRASLIHSDSGDPMHLRTESGGVTGNVSTCLVASSLAVLWGRQCGNRDSQTLRDAQHPEGSNDSLLPWTSLFLLHPLSIFPVSGSLGVFCLSSLPLSLPIPIFISSFSHSRSCWPTGSFWSNWHLPGFPLDPVSTLIYLFAPHAPSSPPQAIPGSGTEGAQP